MVSRVDVRVFIVNLLGLFFESASQNGGFILNKMNISQVINLKKCNEKNISALIIILDVFISDSYWTWINFR